MNGFVYRARTAKGVNFTGALAQNAIATENLTAPGALTGVNGNCRVRLKAISLESKQNLAWEIWLFSKNTFTNTDLDLDTALGFWSFDTTMGVQIADANQYYYYIDGLDVPYIDDGNSGQFHLALVNRSAASKNAGATGEVVVILTCETEGP